MRKNPFVEELSDGWISLGTSNLLINLNVTKKRDFQASCAYCCSRKYTEPSKIEVQCMPGSKSSYQFIENTGNRGTCQNNTMEVKIHQLECGYSVGQKTYSLSLKKYLF